MITMKFIKNCPFYKYPTTGPLQSSLLYNGVVQSLETVTVMCWVSTPFYSRLDC